MLRAHALDLDFNGRALLADVNLHLPSGARIALIGDNGSGKSCLLQMLAGTLVPSGGTIIRRDGARIAYVPQHVLDDSSRSGGEQMRHALARALDAAPDVLLLDEPSNHLDRRARRSLIARLRQFHGALLVATHDEALIDALCNELWHIRGGRVSHFGGRYRDYQADLQQRREASDRQLRQLDQERGQAHEALMREQQRAASSRERGVRKVEQRKWGGVRSATKLGRGNTTAGSKQLQIREQQEDIEARRNDLQRETIIEPTFALPAGWRREGVVVQLTDASVAHATETVLGGLYLRLDVGDRLAITGDNGSGKSTLARALCGDPSIRRDGDWLLPPADQIALLDQHYRDLPMQATPLQALSAQMPDWSQTQCRLHLADFLFRGDATAQTPVSALSGGERARLSLALMAAKPPTLLVLDEPTNNLDMTLRMHLLQVLRVFPGTLVVVSHDDAFLQALEPGQVLAL
ncbi:TPA: ABC-F family ATP-binding cassette domain-containing protein [Stenotrophomonas maltophilia]|nr:ABC-F family ATP-binding cassette domain-containing protein [Stenotrophomonas maltophilia]